MQSSYAWLVGALVTGLKACGDSGNTGGSNTGAAGAGGANAGGSGVGGENAGGESPESACEAALAVIVAKLESCGFKSGVGGGDVGGGNVGGAATFTCTDGEEASWECLRECYAAASCEAVDGTDKEQQGLLSDCFAACP